MFHGDKKQWSALVVAFGSFLLLSVFLAAFATAQTPSMFTGEIVDENLNCIQTPMKAPEGINRKDWCVAYWVRYVQTPPSKYVLYDAATKTTYHLDDQVWVQFYAGAKAQVTGTLDATTKTIKVAGIKAP